MSDPSVSAILAGRTPYEVLGLDFDPLLDTASITKRYRSYALKVIYAREPPIFIFK
jgi:hypothetical protein